MKKAELIEAIGIKTGESTKTISTVVDTMIDTITETLAKGEEVDIHKFAKFETVKQASRTVRNPKTGETKVNPEKNVPKCRFKANVKTMLLG